MHVEPATSSIYKGGRAILHLNGSVVGRIVVRGIDTSWTYGEFEPGPAFSQFAPIFGRWSLLMHDDEHQPLAGATAYELREAERAMDALRARVYFPDQNTWHDVATLNIDGALVEWKEV